MTTAAIDERLGTDPAVAVAVRELVDARYLVAPDAEMVELTARGFGAIQPGNSRASLGGATDCFSGVPYPINGWGFRIGQAETTPIIEAYFWVLERIREQQLRQQQFREQQLRQQQFREHSHGKWTL
ncbi:hypothetical protein GGR34_001535 [Microvirga flocculans]|uniref:Uncharacterized protein n=1 Tax=Microvirga flocculans TaxID=217168 RepID=A0A7W6N7Z6_9HYPH|nr:hypothetical protein [Microvirga flocculans]MBB4039888.1 hypothetical protein [Microvirga flocculans]